uniref:Putative ovule protein n=1 Tax=Solanum chacoense TaxID=4108 RepID=A0A0V0I957_SOLCH
MVFNTTKYHLTHWASTLTVSHLYNSCTLVSCLYVLLCRCSIPCHLYFIGTMKWVENHEVLDLNSSGSQTKLGDLFLSVQVLVDRVTQFLC